MDRHRGTFRGSVPSFFKMNDALFGNVAAHLPSLEKVDHYAESPRSVDRCRH